MAHVVIPTGATIKHIRFSLDGGRIHSLYAPGTLCTWDTQTAKLLDGPYSCATLEDWDSATCSADGTRVVFCHKNKFTLCHVRSNQSMVLCETKDYYDPLGAFFSHDESKFVTCKGYNGMLEVWDAEDGTRVAGPFSDAATYYSISGTYLCCGFVGYYHLIDITTGEKTSIQCWNCVFTPDGLHVAGQAGSFIHMFHMWNMLGQVVASVEIPCTLSGLGYIDVLECSSDGWLLLSGKRAVERLIWRSHFDSPPFALNHDGWILNHDQQPLFWVPAEVREDFPGCNGAIIADCEDPLLTVGYDGMLVGDNWSQCYVPNTRPMRSK